jgi:hypothetical protein
MSSHHKCSQTCSKKVANLCGVMVRMETFWKPCNFLSVHGKLWSRFVYEKLQIDSIIFDLETKWKPKNRVLAKNVFFDFSRHFLVSHDNESINCENTSKFLRASWCGEKKIF